MKTMSFESTPCSSSEAAVAMATGMAMRSSPGGMTQKISNVDVMESNGVWIAVVMVELEEELEPEIEGEEEKSGGDKARDAHAQEHDVAESYYYFMHAHHSTDAPTFPEVDDIAQEPAVPNPAGEMDQTAQDVGSNETAPEDRDALNSPDSLSPNADDMADQLITDFNEPVPPLIPLDVTRAETPQERLEREREEELRRMEVVNNPPTPEAVPPPLT